MNTIARTSFLKNPFVRLSGGKAFLYGLLALLVSFAVLSMASELPFYMKAEFLENMPAILQYVWSIGTILLTILIYYLGGRLFSKSKNRIRFIDSAGVVAFSNYVPMLVFYIIYLIYDLFGLLAGPKSLLHFILWILLIFIFVFQAVWAYIWMYRGLKVTSNITGWRLALTYVAGIVVPTVFQIIFMIPYV